MNVEYLNPVIEAAVYVLKTVCSIDIKTGKPYLTRTKFNDEIFVVMIGITGELHGQVILYMNKEVACDLASRMMMGMEITSLDEIAISALGELANMMMGNAMTNFFNRSIKLDITPPTMYLCEKLDLSVTDSTMICMPLNYDDNYLIELNLAIKE